MNMSVAGRQVREIKNEPPVGRYVGGVTAESVAGQQRPVRSESDFYARGGIANTANQALNKIAERKQQKYLTDAYEEYLQMGERGADVVYNDAIAKYGPEAQQYGEDAKAWFPTKDAFYDENGRFLSNKYAESIYTGTQKLKEHLFKLGEEQKDREANVAAAGAIPGAVTQDEAARRATIGAAGRKTGPMVETQVKAVPTKQQIDTGARLMKNANDLLEAKGLDRTVREKVALIQKSGKISAAKLNVIKDKLKALESRRRLVEDIRDNSMGSRIGTDVTGEYMFGKNQTWDDADKEAKALLLDLNTFDADIDELLYEQTGGVAGKKPTPTPTPGTHTKSLSAYNKIQ